MVYALCMLFFGLALLVAARPNLDNPGCYRDGWDITRGVCEGISLLFSLYMIFEEISHIIRLIVTILLYMMIVGRCHIVQQMKFFHSSFSRRYFKNFSTYLQLTAIVLPFLIILFRAATTWCASTGDGYCVDPTLLQQGAANASWTSTKLVSMLGVPSGSLPHWPTWPMPY